MRQLRVALLILAPLVAVACNKDDGTDGPIEDPTFADVQTILTAKCAFAGCHDGNTSFPPLVDPAYGDIVGVTSQGLPTMNLIEAGNADQSYLYHKIAGTFGDVGGGGSPMPLSGGPLTDADVGTIENWIEDGAPQ